LLSLFIAIFVRSSSSLGMTSMCIEESIPSKYELFCISDILLFLVSAEIQNQIDSLMEATLKGWGCKMCGFDSNNKTRMWEHVEAKHVDTGGYHCKICTKFCKSSSSLRNHMDRYHKEMKKVLGAF